MSRTLEGQAQATCPHPREYLRPAEHWGLLGPLLRRIRCVLCGGTW